MIPVPFGIAALAALGSGLAGPAGLAASVEPAPEDVSPGVLGFLVTLAVVLACIPLFRSMTGKIRGVEFRDQNGTEDAPDAGTPSAPSPNDSPRAPTQGGPPDDRSQDPPPARP